MRVLITGAAGKVGTTLVKALHDRYELYGLDRAPMPHLARVTVGDVADYELVRKASEGMDAIIHLAGMSHVWEEVLHDNLIGTYNVFEAARQNRGAPPGLRQPRRTAQSVSQSGAAHGGDAPATGEPLLPQQGVRRGLGLHICEPAWAGSRPRCGLATSSWSATSLSIPTISATATRARVFERAIIAPLDQLEVPFAVAFGVSNSNWPLYDLEHGRRAIGYDPQDYADVPPEERI